MSLLTIHPEDRPEHREVVRDAEAVAERLRELGVLFERWRTDAELPADADQDAVLAAYAAPIQRLKDRHGFQSVDVVCVNEDVPRWEQLRSKFLSEHVHADFEARFFVAGRGLFYLHPDDKVYGLLCEEGDLLSVPAGVKHWFDMGDEPYLKCIRLFTTEQGWQADFTGDEIGARFPGLEQFVRENA